MDGQLEGLTYGQLIEAVQIPPGVEIHMADGIFIKQMHIPKKNTLVAQHSHAYDHTSMIARGSVRVWEDGALAGSYVAPTGILIKAGVMHTFQSMEDDTVVYCIHNLHGEAAVKVLAENGIEGIV